MSRSLRLAYQSIVLIGLVSFFCNLPAQVALAPADGAGTAEYPYQITSLENLYWIAAGTDIVPSPNQETRWSRHYLQTSGIDASPTSGWFGGLGWSPIGNGTVKFTGSFNGQDYEINRLFINRSGTDHIGLFGYIEWAVVQRVGITNADITGRDYVGSLVGESRYHPVHHSHSEVMNCYSTGIVNGTNHVGGLIGQAYGSDNTGCYSLGSVSGNNYLGGLAGSSFGSNFSNCNSAVTIDATGVYIGGLIGWLSGSSCTNSHSTGNVKTSNTSAGGLVGQTQVSSTITHCYSTGNVIGKDTVGGSVGYHTGYSVLSKTFSIGNVQATNEFFFGSSIAGGLVGHQSGYAEINNCYSRGNVHGLKPDIGGLAGLLQTGSSIANSYSTGVVSCPAETENVGGLVGRRGAGTEVVTNSYWDRISSLRASSNGGTGKTTAEMTYPYDENCYQGWNFVNVWVEDNALPRFNNGYPYLHEQTEAIDFLVEVIPLEAGWSDPVAFELTKVTINFDAPSPEQSISSRFIRNNPGGSIPDGSPVEVIAPVYWTIISSHSNPGTYSISFNISGMVPGVSDPATLHLFKRSTINSPWVDEGVPDTVDGTLLTWNNLSGFSDFGVGGYGGNTLPVELSTFTVSLTSGRDAYLLWVAETETNMLGYNIFRNIESNLSGAEVINESVIPANNSSITTGYNFTDRNVKPGETYYYWLESVDLDLTSTFHGPVSLTVNEEGEQDSVKPSALVTKLIGVFPNPFNISAAISFSLSESDEVYIGIYNIRGQRIRELAAAISYPKGTHNLVWDGKDSGGTELPTGIYLYRLQTARGYDSTGKMMLLK